MSAARHDAAPGLGFTLDAQEDAAKRSSLPLLLLLLVVALTAATVWFIAVPQLTKTAPAVRSCEVLVDALGNTRCVSKQKLESRTAHGAKPTSTD
jgi:hypothetical protein